MHCFALAALLAALAAQDPPATGEEPAPQDPAPQDPPQEDPPQTAIDRAAEFEQEVLDRLGEPDDAEERLRYDALVPRLKAIRDQAVMMDRVDDDLLELMLSEVLSTAPVHPYRAGNFAWQLLVGAEFHDGNNFSDPNAYVRFIGDTALNPPARPGLRRWDNIHGIVDIGIATVPVEGQSSELESEKALIGSIGFDWLPLVRPPSRDRYQTQIGIAVRAGVESLSDAPTGADEENEFWGYGLTVRTAPAARWSDPNPLPYAAATILWGEYETLNDHAFTFSGLLRFVPEKKPGSDDSPWGMFIGVRAVVDYDGEDDLRLQIGVQDGFALLKDIFELPKTLFGVGD